MLQAVEKGLECNGCRCPKRLITSLNIHIVVLRDVYIKDSVSWCIGGNANLDLGVIERKEFLHVI
jgi:hypothetical protein